MGSPGSCNLELSLVSPASSSGNHTYDRQPEQEPQQLTMFYNGRYCVCDVTELQARAIIMLAGSSQDKASTSADDKSLTSTGPAISSPAPAVGLSMKRSLQRFLQKRKGRVQAAAVAPYSRGTAFQKKELQFQINGFSIVSP